MNRNVVIALVVGLVVGFLAGGMMRRYAITSATRPNDLWMIDTWTGRAWYDTGLAWKPFHESKKEPVEPSDD